MDIFRCNGIDFVPGVDRIRLRQKTLCTDGRIEATALEPPIMVNLREDAKNDDPNKRSKLTDSELAYFRRNGNNAVIFIHGFNVGYGDYGRYIDDVVREEKIDDATQEKTVYLNTKLGDPVTVYRSPDDLLNRFPQLKEKGATIDAALDANRKLNGTGARGWYVRMEYELNRAAGFDGKKWENYQRIIGVAWSGDVSPVNYLNAEDCADRAAVGLVELISQLNDADVKINIIAHSLGNRVALVALNQLATNGIENALSHLFMWQPAVPDTVFTDNPKHDTSKKKNWFLPNAYRATKKIVVLYSSQDNVLGSHRSAKDFIEDMFPGNDGAIMAEEAVAGLFLTSSYNIAHSVGASAKDLLFSPWSSAGKILKNFDRRLRSDVRVVRDDIANLRSPSEYELPPPLTINVNQLSERSAKFLKHMIDSPNGSRKTLNVKEVERYLDECEKNKVGTDTEGEPRPALGWVGDESVRKFDNFTRQLFSSSKVEMVDQSLWLFSHSGMMIPSEELRERVYKDEIWERLKKTTRFGNYS